MDVARDLANRSVWIELSFQMMELALVEVRTLVFEDSPIGPLCAFGWSAVSLSLLVPAEIPDRKLSC
ncbi:hypothetical protein BK665_18210 [Pseudomonas frederiksbergensis]|uniref:Uncharacterized protein n=1 Tax=Pseudomonas frederiksbergensis TaxID=104087 RepID=A0A423KG64_9PSED|nr:hypothetical protein BK665_18210 [Pseudomonas frederiksbergensis]